MHWNDQFGSSGCIDAVVNPATDPISGEPEFKHTPVKVEPLAPKWYGFLLSRRKLNFSVTIRDTQKLPLPPGEGRGEGSSKAVVLPPHPVLLPEGEGTPPLYWSVSRGQGLWRYELAGDELPQDWASAARAVLCARDEKVEWIEYFDKAARRYRAARLTKGKLESCIFIGPSPQLPPRDWLAGLFALETLDAPTRAGLLAGTPPKGSRDVGRQVCACFGVGEAAIVEAIQSGCATAGDVGIRLKAGTNCGSCLPEVKGLIARVRVEKKIT